jgi:transcriptional regulator with XRE-family HTH domain
MTQEEFAGRIGMSQNYLSTKESGTVEVGAEILLRISREYSLATLVRECHLVDCPLPCP